MDRLGWFLLPSDGGKRIAALFIKRPNRRSVLSEVLLTVAEDERKIVPIGSEAFEYLAKETGVRPEENPFVVLSESGGAILVRLYSAKEKEIGFPALAAYPGVLRWEVLLDGDRTELRNERKDFVAAVVERIRSSDSRRLWRVTVSRSRDEGGGYKCLAESSEAGGKAAFALLSNRAWLVIQRTKAGEPIDFGLLGLARKALDAI